MIRDKSYVRVDNGWLFNVTGDDHPNARVFASLKYVDRRKWTQGYAASVAYLRSVEPTFVDDEGFISVPRERITAVLDPFERWQELQQQDTCSPLHRQALELASRLHAVLGVTDFGITDSLLWGDGHPDSDIDLVTRGRVNAERFWAHRELLYTSPDFRRPSPETLRAPYGQDVPDWPRVLRRKLHMGSFQGRLFSLRVVLRASERQSHPWASRSSHVDLAFDVTDATDSLLFPAVYRNPEGDELVDYSVVYEGVFRPGDRVECECEHLVSRVAGQPERNRYVLRRVRRFRAGPV